MNLLQVSSTLFLSFARFWLDLFWVEVLEICMIVLLKDNIIE